MTSIIDTRQPIAAAKAALDELDRRHSIHLFIADMAEAAQHIHEAIGAAWVLLTPAEQAACVRHCTAVGVPFTPPQPARQFTITVHDLDANLELVPREVARTDSPDTAWLEFVSRLREDGAFADGEATAHFAWEFFSRGRSVRCNGIALDVCHPA